MKFDLVSDLHVDHNSQSLNWLEIKSPDSNCLVIAGDTSNHIVDVVAVLKRAKAAYEHVAFVDGNHEWYNYPYTNHKAFRDIAAETGAVFLYDTDLLIEDTVFIGVNGWYDFSATNNPYAAKKRFISDMNDYTMIWKNRDIEPEHCAFLQADKLANKVSDYQSNGAVKNIIVVTHTAPRKELVGAPGVAPGTDHLDACFANITMGDVVRQKDCKNKIKVWCFGHTHQSYDRTLDGVRYVNNSRGYGFEHKKWSPVQIDTEADIFPF